MDKKTGMIRMMQHKKTIFLMLMMTIAVIFYGNGIVFADDSFEVTIDKDGAYAINDRNSYNVIISVKNNSNKDFSGKVRFITLNSMDVLINRVYEEDVTIAAGGTYEFETYADFFGIVGGLCVNVLDEDDNVLYDKTFDMDEMTNSRYYVYECAVLSDSEDIMDKFMDAVNSNTYEKGDLEITISDYKVNFYDGETFPDLYEELSDMKFIVISDFDTERLSNEQMDAIKKYVYNGGNIVIGTGESADRTLAGFSDILSYNINSISLKSYDSNYSYELDAYSWSVSKELKAYEYYRNSYDYEDFEDAAAMWDEMWQAYYKGETMEYTQEQLIYKSYMDEFAQDTSVNCQTADITIDNAAYTEGEKGNIRTFVQYGRGLIIVYGIDFADSAYEVFFEDFLININNEDLYGDSEYVYMENARANLITYVVLIVIYVIVVSFLVYVVLKIKNKRQLLWITVPVVSVIFAFIFAVAGGSKSTRDIMSYVTINIYSDTGDTISNTDFTFVNNYAGKYNLEIDTENEIYMDSVYTSDYSYRYGSQNSLEYAEAIVDYYNYNYFENGEFMEEINTLYQSNPNVVVNNSSGKKVLRLENIYPYCVSKFRFSQSEQTDKKFEIAVEENSDGKRAILKNNTGNDLRCVMLATVYGYIYIGRLDAGGQVNIDDYTVSENTELIYGTFMPEDVSESTARTLWDVYMNITNNVGLCNNSQILVLGLEGTVNDALGQDWQGVTVAEQLINTKESMITLTDEYKANKSETVVGVIYEHEVIISGGNTFDYMQGYDGEILMLYDIPEGALLTGINYELSELNRLRDEYTESDDEKEVKVYAYNYKTNEYDLIFEYGYYGKITDTDDYYGKDKPLRLKLENINNDLFVVPDFQLEVD